MLTVFFGSFIAGSLLNQVNAIIHDPTTLVDILGEAAPQVAVFFMTYLLLMVRLLAQLLLTFSHKGLVSIVAHRQQQITWPLIPCCAKKFL